MQTPREQNTIQLHRIKTVNTRKTKGGNACGESHGVARGEGAGAPAPTAAGSTCPYCTVLGPGHGERAAPAPGTSPRTQKWKEERQGALEQTDSTVPAHLWALSPEAMVQAAVSSLESLCCSQTRGSGVPQRFVPPSSQASSTGQRRRQTQALQRANTGDLHISPKHESEPVVPCPHLLS